LAYLPTLCASQNHKEERAEMTCLITEPICQSIDNGHNDNQILSIQNKRNFIIGEGAKFDAGRATFVSLKFTSMELSMVVKTVKILPLSLLMTAYMIKNDSYWLLESL
jgi:hypothetical protein